ncbi:unnamed protein product [Miscanthus lutarioriparius]|uniref:Knottins-like domain-containing protein n=1 Tax=Miscanthus lutarioriparius TaxID=422564 RepID=A0A811Q2Z7_9POAL|nr:unnamed protein product [Miscanthus lutarioriparius]
MAPSRKNLFVAVLLIIVIVAAVCSMPACTQSECRHLSGKYHGLCFVDYACDNACSFEEPEIIYGACDDFKCYCHTC